VAGGCGNHGLEVAVQKELQITTPDDDVIPLEFLERIQFNDTFRKCRPSQLPPEITTDLLRCQIVRTTSNRQY